MVPGMDLARPEAFIERAHGAYLASDGLSAEQPVAAYSGVRRLSGRDYVTLANKRHVLAVYRIRQSGRLRRMRRPPVGLVGREPRPSHPSGRLASPVPA